MIPVYGLQGEMIHLLRPYDSKLKSHHTLTHKHLSIADSQLANVEHCGGEPEQADTGQLYH